MPFYKVFPQIYSWASFPITSALTYIYDTYIKSLNANSPPVDPYVVEVASILERGLNFMHTGSARVIHTTTMGANALFPGASLIQHGTMFFSNTVTFSDGVDVKGVNWPGQATGVPKSSASRSAQYAYGGPLEQVSVLCNALPAARTCPVEKPPLTSGLTLQNFMAHLRLECLVKWTTASSTDARQLRGEAVAKLLVNQMVSDIVDFTLVEVGRDADKLVKDAEGNRDKRREAIADSARRDRSARTWAKDRFPLAHNPGTVFLVRALRRGEVDPGAQSLSSLPGSDETFFLEPPVLARRMLKVAQKTKTAAAPLIKKGQLPYLLPPAWSQFLRIHHGDNEAAGKAFIQGVLDQMLQNRITWVPFKKGQPDGAAASIAHWTRVASGATSSVIPSDYMTGEEAADATIRRALQSDQNPAAEWSLSGLLIKDCHKYLSRRSPPQEFASTHLQMSADASISGQYRWVFTNFRMANIVHRYCLFVAHIFSLSAPNFDHGPRPTSGGGGRGSASKQPLAEDIMQSVRDAAWLPTTNSRGDSGKTDRVTMAVTAAVFMISALDPESPVFKSEIPMPPWTTKHSTYRRFTPVAAWI